MELNFENDIKLIGNKISTKICFTCDDIKNIKSKLESICSIIEVSDDRSLYVKNTLPVGSYLIDCGDGEYELYVNQVPYIEFRYYMNRIVSVFKSMDKIFFYIDIEKFFSDVNNIKKFLLSFKDDHKSKYRKLDIEKPLDLKIAASGFDSQVSTILNDDTLGFGITFTDSRICIKDFNASDFNFEDAIKRINHIMLLCMGCIDCDLTDEENERLLKINNSYNSLVTTFSNADSVLKIFPKLTVDLDPSPNTIAIYLLEFNDVLYKSLYLQDITDCDINFDTDNKRIQIKDLKRSGLYLSDIDVVSCEIKDSKIESCDVYMGEFEGVKFVSTNVYSYVNIKNSRIINSFISVNTICDDCNVFGSLGKFTGVLSGKKSKIHDTVIVKSIANIMPEVFRRNIVES